MQEYSFLLFLAWLIHVHRAVLGQSNPTMQGHRCSLPSLNKQQPTMSRSMDAAPSALRGPALKHSRASMRSSHCLACISYCSCSSPAASAIGLSCRQGVLHNVTTKY
eukprot:1161985-Pelagomonas_calceolata.AAC.3